MKNRFRLYALCMGGLLGCLAGKVKAQYVEVGKWYTHFSLGNITELFQREALVYGASDKTIYYVDTRDGQMKKLDRASGLSNVGISAVCYNSGYDVIIVGYENGYVDLVYGNDVVTLDYIYTKDLGCGKRINGAYTEGRYAYLATDFGLVTVDLKKEEIKETYLSLRSGEYEKFNSVFIFGGDFYVSVGGCIKRVPVSAPNLNDYSIWKTDTCMENEEISRLMGLWGKVVAVGKQGLYWGCGKEGFLRMPITVDSTRILKYVKTDALGQRLVLGWQEEAGNGVVEIWRGMTERELRADGFNYRTGAMIDDEGYLWTSSSGRLYKSDHEGRDIASYVFSGPYFDNHYHITFTGHNVVSCSEVMTYSDFVPARNALAFSVVKNSDWSNYNAENLGIPDSIGFYSAAMVLEDPQKDNRYYIASSVSGIAVAEPGSSWKIYDMSNSPIAGNRVNHADMRFMGLAFDGEGTLWMLENLSDTSLYALHKDGSWEAYDLRCAGYSMDRVSNLLVDYWNHKWVFFNRCNVAVFETNGQGGIRALQVDMNYGNDLHTGSVYCVVEDHSGYLWFGTDRGVKMIDRHAAMFDNPRGNQTSVEVKTIKVPRDGFLLELLKDDQVRSIAVDGADRKWLGTYDHGVYLVSPDGMEELAHFDEDNSPLLSNHVKQITVDQQTGEVFFVCEGGLISYRGTATKTETFDDSKVRVFPNPVRPGYTGLISVRGLPENAMVKITDTKGALIYQAKATGGQISWNGYNMQGRKPESGVLLVFANGEDKAERVVCKIFYVR